MQIFQPWQLLVVAVSGWINRHQQDVIVYIEEENRILKQKLKGKRIRFTDDERRRLAVKGKALGRKVLREVASIITPDTILVLRHSRCCRRWTPQLCSGPVLSVGRGTIANILKEHGIEPAPERSKRTPWRTFLRAHWECLAAGDLFTVEVWTVGGLVRYYVLLFMRISTRRVHIAGITANPHGKWILQVARNVTDSTDGFLLNTAVTDRFKTGHDGSNHNRPVEPTFL